MQGEHEKKIRKMEKIITVASRVCHDRDISKFPHYFGGLHVCLNYDISYPIACWPSCGHGPPPTFRYHFFQEARFGQS